MFRFCMMMAALLVFAAAALSGPTTQAQTQYLPPLTSCNSQQGAAQLVKSLTTNPTPKFPHGKAVCVYAMIVAPERPYSMYLDFCRLVRPIETVVKAKYKNGRMKCVYRLVFRIAFS